MTDPQSIWPKQEREKFLADVALLWFVKELARDIPDCADAQILKALLSPLCEYDLGL